MIDVASGVRVAGREIDRRSSGDERGLDWADVQGTDSGYALIANAGLHLTDPPWATLAAWTVRSSLLAACPVFVS